MLSGAWQHSFAQPFEYDLTTRENIVAALEQFQKRYRLVSLSFALFQGEQTRFEHALGYANLAARQKATADHIYTTASVTKTLTGLTAIDLVQQGYLALGDSVRTIISGFPENVTFLDLLNHTSGFLRENENEKFLNGSHYRNVVDYLPVKFNLKIHRYANFNYAAVGAVLEKVMQRQFRDIVAEYYLSITGDSLYFSNHRHSGADDRFVKNYVRRGRRVYLHDVVDFGLWEPAAFAQTSANSLITFLRAHMRPHYIRYLESHAVTIKNRRNRSGQTVRDCYALGLRLRYVDGELQYIYHNGFLYGVLSTLYYFPKMDLGFAALSNMSYYPRQRVAMSGLYRQIERIMDDAFHEHVARYAAQNGYVAGAIYYKTNRVRGEVREDKLMELAQSYLAAEDYHEALNLYKLISFLFPDSKPARQHLANAYKQVGNEEVADELLTPGGGTQPAMEPSDSDHPGPK